MAPLPAMRCALYPTGPAQITPGDYHSGGTSLVNWAKTRTGTAAHHTCIDKDEFSSSTDTSRNILIIIHDEAHEELEQSIQHLTQLSVVPVNHH